MNVSYTKTLLQLSQYLLLLILPFSLMGQQNQPYEANNVVSGTTFTKTYTNASGVSVIIKAPLHAQSYSLNSQGNNYTFSYTPANNFYGKDYVLIEYYPVWPGPPSYIGLELIVVKSILNTKVDYVTISKNQNIVIPVLNNDNTTAPGLTLSANVPYVFHGTAAPSGNSISFTPETDFVGVANVNYVACDAQNTCKVGSVVIKVTETDLPAFDTLRYTLVKNGSVIVLLGLGDNGVKDTDPAHGTLSNIANDVVLYTPNSNYVGLDQFKYKKTIGNNTYYKTVLINVFNTNNGNHFAMDDYAATPKNKFVTLNVLANDIGNYTVLNPASMTSPNGTITYLGNGNVKFTPNNNFTGTATFNYKVGFPGYPVIETGKVSIEVSNQAPSSTIFNLTTLQEKPLLLKYFVPFDNWTFEVDDQADHGNVVVYPGQQTINIENQQVAGYNMVVYTPAAGFVNDNDEFSLRYCTPTGVCSYLKIDVYVKENPNPNSNYCVGDCVWAGDTDGDGVVSVKDILPIAMCMGVPGVERADATLDWIPQFGENWSNPYETTPEDLKHIDTDGDGLISVTDTIAINQSYGLLHEIPNNSKIKLENRNLIFVPRDTVITGGSTLITDVYFGTQSKPVYNAHGLAYKFNFNPIIPAENISVIYDEQNWLVKDAASLGMNKVAENGVLHVAYGRTGPTAITGFGKLGIVIVEDVQGIKSSDGYATFKITDINYLNDQGEYVYEPDQEIRVRIGAVKPNTDPVNDNDIAIYPNPAGPVVNIATRNGINVLKSNIITATGQILQTGTDSQLDVSNIPTGLYFIQLETNRGLLTKKFEKIN